MKEKHFGPGRDNTESPSPGLAAVNTHNPDEEPIENEERVKGEKVKSEDRERIQENENRKQE